MTQPASRRLATEAALAAKQDVATLGASVASDATVRAAFGRPRALAKLHAGLAARTASPCRLVFTGSSTTEGLAATTTANRYVNRLVAAIQAAYPSGTGTETAVVASIDAQWGMISVTPGVHGYNAGQNGAFSDGYISDTEVNRIAALNPRAVFHMIGSNDFNGGVNPTTYEAQVQGRIAALKAQINGPCVHILVHSFQRMDTPSPVYSWAEYGKALRRITDADPDNVALIDISEPYALVGVPGTDPLNLVDSSGVHQTDAGHAFMADLIRQAIEIPGAHGDLTIVEPPATYAADTFDRANGPLGTTEIGALTWAVDGGTMEVVSNAAQAVTVTNTGRGVVATVDTGQTNGVLRALPGSAATGIAFRMDPTTLDGYLFIYSTGAGAYRLTKRTGTAFSTIATGAATPFNADVELSVELSGSSIVCKAAGVTQVSVTDTSYSSTRHGVIAVNATNSVRSWSHAEA